MQIGPGVMIGQTNGQTNRDSTLYIHRSKVLNCKAKPSKIFGLFKEQSDAILLHSQRKSSSSVCLSTAAVYISKTISKIFRARN